MKIFGVTLAIVGCGSAFLNAAVMLFANDPVPNVASLLWALISVGCGVMIWAINR